MGRDTIGDYGEFNFLAKLIPGLRRGAGVVVGPGQDCAVVRAGRARLLVTVDAVVEGVHFRPRWLSPQQLGRRSFLVNASDIAAMGGRPRWCVAGIGLPRDYSRRSLELIHRGIDAAAAELGAAIVGGNLTASSRLSITITLIAAAPRRLITRRGAAAGDSVYVTGTLGDAAVGVRRLRRGATSGHAVQRYREPTPRLNAGRLLAESGVASAMIDVSDGLLQDLGHICDQSGVGAEIDAERVPLSAAYRRECGDDLSPALAGGEDYELLFTVPARRRPALERLRPRLRCPVTEIGEMTTSRRQRIIGRGLAGLKAAGYDHFS
jgi:thiamine-monophosphate kinase